MEADKWRQLSLAEQLGNIGSEFHRWMKTRSEKSFEEVLSLLDMTIADGRWRDRLSELLRLREVICDTSLGSPNYKTQPALIDNYLFSFAVLARK